MMQQNWFARLGTHPVVFVHKHVQAKFCAHELKLLALLTSCASSASCAHVSELGTFHNSPIEISKNMFNASLASTPIASSVGSRPPQTYQSCHPKCERCRLEYQATCASRCA